MKQLSSFMVLGINGGDRVTYTYDIIDDQTGEPVSTNNKASFFVVDDALAEPIASIRQYIREHKLS